MRVVMFYQSLISDWNHGNAHFLRGVATELLSRGHSVAVYEPEDSWSLQNLLAEHGAGPIDEFHASYPRLSTHRYRFESLDLAPVLDGADLVIVHEWNENRLIEKIGRYARTMPSLKLLFHDTHHRLANEDRLSFSLADYDGVLAYGRVLADKYLRRGWTARAWVWHEAADTRVFHPRPDIEKTEDIVWVGNWGDDERTGELRDFLIEPAEQLRLTGSVFGVRYPDAAIASLKNAGLSYRGWLANFKVPEAFARARMTVHIPRRPYVKALPGIPTIRPFEALACGIPLVCSPWDDRENLFTPGDDYLIAKNGSEMRKHLVALKFDRAMADELALHGLVTVLERHTCAHRVDELLAIYRDLATEPERHARVRQVSRVSPPVVALKRKLPNQIGTLRFLDPDGDSIRYGRDN